MTAYGQFCPVAKAMELLDERWTLLIVRELLAGSRRFNDVQRGVPRMSPALLSKRLRALTRAGVVRRVTVGNRPGYELTDAGRELGEVVEALGRWGVRWIGHLGEEDLDPALLLWDVQRRIDVAALPRSRTVIAFHFPDVEAKLARWWIVVDGDEVDVCDFDPEFEVTVQLTSTLRAMTSVWRGDVSWSQALHGGAITVAGDPAVRRAVPNWFRLSAFATTPRPALAGASA